GASGTFVTSGHSRTSSTSSTGKQKRSRPLRKTQYCDSGGRSPAGPSASSISPSSASAGMGVSWKSSLMPGSSLAASNKPSHGPQKFFARKGLGHVAIRALLLAPIPVARGIFGRHQNYRDG